MKDRPAVVCCSVLLAGLMIVACGGSREDPVEQGSAVLSYIPAPDGTDQSNQLPLRHTGSELINCACADAMVSLPDTSNIDNNKNVPTADQHAKGAWGDAFCTPASAFIMMKWMATVFGLDTLIDNDAVKTIEALANRMISGSSSGTSPGNVLKGFAKYLVLDKNQDPTHWRIYAYDERGNLGTGDFQQNGVTISKRSAASYDTIKHHQQDPRSIVMVWQQQTATAHHVMVIDAMNNTSVDGKYDVRVSDPNINGTKVFKMDADGHMFDADGKEFIDRMWVVLRYVGP